MYSTDVSLRHSNPCLGLRVFGISKISDTESTAPGYIKQLTRGRRGRAGDGAARGGKRRARAKGAQWHVRHRGNGHGLAGGINDVIRLMRAEGP